MVYVMAYNGASLTAFLSRYYEYYRTVEWTVDFDVSVPPTFVTEFSNILVCLGANVLIDDAQGSVKLRDFGIGKDLQVCYT